MHILRSSAVISLLLGLISVVSGPAPALAATSGPPAPLALEINTEGIYRLTYSYLDHHNFSPSKIDVRMLGLSDSGSPVPIFVYRSESGGHTFGPQDYVEFYAHPVFNTYTTTNTYVLTADGKSVWHVHQKKAAVAHSATTVAQNTYVDQQRTFYDPVQDNAPAYDVSTAWPSSGDAHWKETQMIVDTPQPSTSFAVNFSLPSPSATGACTISAPTLGYADQSTGAPTFQMGIQVGSSNVVNANDGTTSFTWSAPTIYADTVANGSFPCSALGTTSGTTAAETVTFSSMLQSPVRLGEVLPQYFSITYPELLDATRNQLSWTGSGSPGYSLSGFNKSNISVWKVQPHAVTRLAQIHTHATIRRRRGTARQSSTPPHSRTHQVGRRGTLPPPTRCFQPRPEPSTCTALRGDSLAQCPT